MNQHLSQNIVLLENFKLKINELVGIKNQLFNTFVKHGMKNDSKQLSFKLRSYSKWLQNVSLIINDLKQNNNCKEIYINDLTVEENIKKLKLSSGLETKLIEFSKDNNFKDILDTQNKINELETRSNSNTSSNDSMVNIQQHQQNDIGSNQINTGSNQINIDGHNIINKGITKIDTSKIEAIPKQMLHETRPTDKIGGMIYDLKLVTGIGAANAKSLANDNVSLELLIKDWTEYINKDNNNSILLISKMGKPNMYSDNEWNSFTNSKRHKIHLNLLHKRLLQDTQYLHKLNHHQLIGIKYFDDFSKKIPRDEVQSCEKILKVIANKMNPDFHVTICGSYRRGRNRSGDVDTLLTHSSIKTTDDLKQQGQGILNQFIFILEQTGFLVDHLTNESTTKYMGVCICPKKSKIARRIDIRFVPYQSYSASILYFTGSKNFNTAMRAHALHKGYTLNEYGLFKLENGKKTEQVICPTEEDIFKALDYKYVEPEQRDV